MKKLFDSTGFLKWLLIALTFISFVVLKFDGTRAIVSVDSVFVGILISIGFALLYYVIFEVLIALFFTALKNKTENYLINKNFYNIFRFLIIFVNLILFAFNKLFIYLNFYTIYFMLIFAIIIYFLMFIFGYLIINKYYVKKQVKFESLYFQYAFIFLIIFTFMWGVL